MIPHLTGYDIILINTSGGKDSQAMLDYAVDLAEEAGVADRIIAVHCDLGRLEWPGTRELAERQAQLKSVPFEVVRNRNWQDLLHRVEGRGKWPDAATRYCTSEFKTGQVHRLMTRLVAEANLGRQVRILNCLGMRAQESPSRAKKPAFEFDKAASNGKRHVDRWLPIHHWTVEQVWERIHASCLPYHPVYDQGMPRLSCSFCVLASKGALIRAAQLRPDLAQEYLAVEQRINHRFRKDLSMADIIAAAGYEAEPVITDWAA